MPPVGYEHLSEDVQQDIAKLKVELEELRYEATFYRFAVLITLVIVVERIWDRLG